MIPRLKPDTFEPIREAAASWSVRLARPGCPESDRLAFDAWLAEDPSHEAAFDQVQGALHLIARHGDDPRLKALAAAADRDAANTAGNRRAWRLRALAASLALTGLVSAGLFLSGQMGPGSEQVAALPSHETPVGERTMVTLSDGSAVTLNTNSRIEVDYSEGQRRVVLTRGQAYFDIATEPDRPFVAEAGPYRVVALGTAFDVRLEGPDALEVTLLEGRVGVSPARAFDGGTTDAPAPVELEPGERFNRQAGGAPEVTRPDLNTARAWQQGMVVFQAASLRDVASEMNRYNAEKLVLDDDARFQDIEVTGVFKARDAETLITVLEAKYPLEARPEETGGWTVVWRE